MTTTANPPPVSVDNKEVKLAILKKGIIEERKKVQQLQDEISSLKDTLTVKDELISKLKNEHQSISDALGKQDPKSYYDNLFKAQEDNQAELSELKVENDKLKAQLEALLVDNSQMKEKLEEASHTHSTLQTESSKKIEQLTEQIKAYIVKEDEDQRKLSQMSEYFRKTDIVKAEYEEKICAFEQKMTHYKQLVDRLLKDNANLTEQNSTFDKLIAHLKEEIERLTMSSYQLKQDLESMRVYPKDHVFKGKVIGLNRKNEVQLTFGKYADALCIQPQGEKERLIAMNDLIEVKKEKWNVICVFYYQLGVKKEMRCEFDANQIEYIVKYAQELVNKNEKKKDQFFQFTLGTPFI